MTATLFSQALPRKLSRRACAALLLGAALGALPAAHAAPAAAQSAVRVTDAWIRWLPAGLPAGGYMQLHNDGAHLVSLIGASSPDYGQVMVHRSQMQGGTMHMDPVERVDIPAHGSVAFQPGGYHIMLMQPKHDVQPGQKVPLTLKFSDGEQLSVSYEVRKPDAGGGMQGMPMHGHGD